MVKFSQIELVMTRKIDLEKSSQIGNGDLNHKQ